MKSTPFLLTIEQAQNELTQLLAKNSLIEPIVQMIYEQKGSAYLVGGAVRDIFLRVPVYDLDIEVHNVELDDLAIILKQFGEVSHVGKSFGILKLHGTNYDWSLPRTDAGGRKPEVTINPSMDIVEALRRRDLTMNAMAFELKSKAFVDPFGGRTDMERSMLRSPDSTFFVVDPLRFYRVMQFIGRFEMFPDPELESVCSRMNIAHVSRERIEMEFDKLLLKSKRPSLGLRWLSSIGRLQEILPELARTQGVKQEPSWHPEGDVFEHLMQTVDAAAVIAREMKESETESKLILLYAALCHDLGKVTTTIVKDGRIRSPRHAQEGAPLTQSMLKRITRRIYLIEAVKLLVAKHMEPGQLVKAHSTLAAYHRLANRLAKYTSIDMLAKLCLADQRGRNDSGHEPLSHTPEFITTFLKVAASAEIIHKPEPQVLHGKDIADLVEPGPKMGELLKYAYKMQIKRGIKDKVLLKKLVMKKLK